MADLIKELEARISVKRKELEDEERALVVVKRMMGQLSNDLPLGNTSKEQLASINFDDLIGTIEKKRTLIDEVRDVIRQFGKNEFTVAHIEAALKKIGIAVDAKSPRARISIVLSTIVDEGLIVKTMVGGGNVPHRYKLKDSGHDLAG